MAMRLEEMTGLLEKGVSDLISNLSDEEYNHGQLKEMLSLMMNKWLIPENYFIPDQNLIRRIEDYTEWCAGRKDEDGGLLMEEIAYLAFRCLKGYERIMSYRSYSAQHDLEISGSTKEWILITRYLHLPDTGRSIIVEAKNLDAPVNDQQFSRLCGILENKFKITSHLGVFFTRNGATGFPTASKRVTALKDARATQILFHAKTNKFVVVLDDSDIKKLKDKGSLLAILESKIQDVESATPTGLPSGFEEEELEDFMKTELPSHLKKYIN